MTTPGAEGSANRNLPLTRNGLGEKQVGYIGAGDEQHEANGCEKNIEWQTDVANDVVEIWSRAKCKSRAGRKHVRKIIALVFRDCVKIGSGALLRYARSQARDHTQKMRIAHV